MRVFTVTQSMRGGSLPIRGGREDPIPFAPTTFTGQANWWRAHRECFGQQARRPPFGPVIVGTPLQSIVLTMRPEAFVDCAVNVPPMYAPEP